MTLVNFDPNSAAAADAGIYGLPHSAEQAAIIIIPVNWELTVSYGGGTSDGPDAVNNASMQMDLYHHDFPELWKKGIWLDEFPQELKDRHDILQNDAKTIIEAIETGEMETNPDKYAGLYEAISAANEDLKLWLSGRIDYWRSHGKIVGVLGGDHSIPLGYHTYLSDKDPYGILHFDAHCDLRNAFEGFEHSHASIFYNALKYNTITKLVQVGIRDYCEEEALFIEASKGRVQAFFDRDIRKSMYEGALWKDIVTEIINALPEKVYVSVDIDGLDPKLCPNTGTPVPGGMEFEELMYLLNRLKASGKQIVGFDLCEVAPGDDEWDGNVGARVLYQLCGLAAD